MSPINLTRWCLGVDHRIPMHLPPHILNNPGLVEASRAFPSFLTKQQCKGRLEGVLPTSTATLQTPTPCMESSPVPHAPWLACQCHLYAITLSILAAAMHKLTPDGKLVN